MEEIKLTPQELKNIIDSSKLIGEPGSEATLFTYKGKLIKLDSLLYKLLKINDPIIANDIVHDHYRWPRIEGQAYFDRDQLEELSKRQPKIRPKVPEGIITIKDNEKKINGIIPGIIIPYFKDYELLGKVSKEEYKRLLILLRKIFDDIKNLADYEIAHEDLFERHDKNNNPEGNHYNIMQKGNDPQIIDMSGLRIKVGKDFQGADKMYADFAALINYYYELYGIKPLYSSDEHITEEKLNIMLNELDKQTKKR